MNEKIKQLAEQANSHHDNFFDLNYKELDVFLEKFAESIVRECANIVENQGKFLRYTDMASKIKENFGIKK